MARQVVPHDGTRAAEEAEDSMPAGQSAPAAPNAAARSALPVPPPMPSAPLDEAKALTRVCFGSCYAP